MIKKWSHQDSNLDLRLRKPTFYPLNYGTYAKSEGGKRKSEWRFFPHYFRFPPILPTSFGRMQRYQSRRIGANPLLVLFGKMVEFCLEQYAGSQSLRRFQDFFRAERSEDGQGCLKLTSSTPYQACPARRVGPPSLLWGSIRLCEPDKSFLPGLARRAVSGQYSTTRPCNLFY